MLVPSPSLVSSDPIKFIIPKFEIGCVKSAMHDTKWFVVTRIRPSRTIHIHYRRTQMCTCTTLTCSPHILYNTLDSGLCITPLESEEDKILCTHTNDFHWIQLTGELIFKRWQCNRWWVLTNDKNLYFQFP